MTGPRTPVAPLFALAALLLATFPGAALATDGEERFVELHYAPQPEHASPPAGIDESARVLPLALVIEDGRADAPGRTLGQATRKGKPLAAMVSANDPADFVVDGMRGLLEGWGLRLEGQAAHRLTVEMQAMTLAVEERMVAADYSAAMKLRFVLSDGEGNELWKGSSSGRTERRGRKQVTAVYDEVLSDALFGAVSSLFENENFQAALRSASAR